MAHSQAFPGYQASLRAGEAAIARTTSLERELRIFLAPEAWIESPDWRLRHNFETDRIEESVPEFARILFLPATVFLICPG